MPPKLIFHKHKKITSQHSKPVFPSWNGRFVMLSLIALMLASYMSLGQAESVHAQNPAPFDPSEVVLPNGLPNAQQGQAIFAQSCAACHGPAGDSDGPVVPDLPAPPPQFSDPETVWEQSPASYFHTTKFGRIENLMPPWGNQLSDDEIWQAAFYAWSLHTDQATVDAGRQLLDSALANVDEAKRAQVDALFTDADALFRTQSELADELQALLPDIDWSATEMATVLDAGRTLAYTPPWGSSFRAGNGAIEGSVALVLPDGSTSPPDTDNMTATINVVSGRELLATFDTPVDSENNFSFTSLSTDDNIDYYPSIMYNGIAYQGDVIKLSDSEPLSKSFLFVYETSDNPAGIQVTRLNWVVDNSPGEVLIGQIMTLGNQRNTTYTGQTIDGADRPVTTEISIPTGAYDIRFDDGELGDTYLQVGDRIFDTTPITPGDETRRIFVSYRVAYEETSAQIQQDILYPVTVLNMLVADLPGLTHEVPLLEFSGANTVQNLSYNLWTGANLSPQPFTILLDGLLAADAVDPRLETSAVAPEIGQEQQASTTLPTTTPPLDPMIPLALGGLVMVVLGGLVIWPLRREQETDPTIALEAERELLISEIAGLDDRHQAGALRDEIWVTKRAALKTRLLEVARWLEDEQDAYQSDSLDTDVG